MRAFACNSQSAEEKWIGGRMVTYNILNGSAIKISAGIMMLILLFSISTSAATLTVDDSGGAMYTKIPDAINDASIGDTILVSSGNYHERVDVNKQLFLKGIDTGGGKPVLDFYGSYEFESPAVKLSAGGSTFEGFNVKDNYGVRYSYGISVSSNDNIIRNNDFSNNGLGIGLSSSSNNTLSSNNFTNNNNGIHLSYSSINMFTNNNITNNIYGIILSYSSNNMITSNNITNNTYGISLSYSSNNTIYNNFFNNTNNLNSNNIIYGNTWNTSKTPGTNIIGGEYIGGNFWAYPNGTDFSQTCSDSNKDGICDLPYILDSSNIDYQPLSLNFTSPLSNSGGGIWKYSRDLNIINPGGSLLDYQILVNLTSAHFPSEANSSGADIRFTDADGAELAYWIEKWDYAGMSALMWVKAASIPTGISTMSMWYGNPSATSSSNGDSTFELYDDFNDNTFDTVKWSESCTRHNGIEYVPISCIDHVIERNQVLEINLETDAGNHANTDVRSNKNFSEGIAVKYDYKNADSFSYLYKNQILNYNNNNTGWAWRDWGPLDFVGVENGNVYSIQAKSEVRNDNYWFTGQLIYYSNKTLRGIMTRSDGVPYGDVLNSSFPINSPRRLLLQTTLWAGGTPKRIYYDNITIRKFNDPEPWISFISNNLTGSVLNASSGLGINGALVNLSNGQNNITITNGTYIINSVPLGSYFITTTASGYAPNITSITVTEGINIKNILLEQCRNDLFSDIDCGYWGYVYIKYLYDHGVIIGYPDGTFKPENQITRGEAVTFVVKAMNLTHNVFLNDFPDVQSTHWAYPFVMAAKQNGIISGYPDGTFKPDNQVTRAEISVMVTKAKGWTYSGLLTDFPDVPVSQWEYPYVMSVREHGVVNGYPDGTFKPDNQATRAESSVMVKQMMTAT